METIYFKRVYVKPEPWTQSKVQNGPKCKYILLQNWKLDVMKANRYEVEVIGGLQMNVS